MTGYDDAFVDPNGYFLADEAPSYGPYVAPPPFARPVRPPIAAYPAGYAAANPPYPYTPYPYTPYPYTPYPYAPSPYTQGGYRPAHHGQPGQFGPYGWAPSASPRPAHRRPGRWGIALIAVLVLVAAGLASVAIAAHVSGGGHGLRAPSAFGTYTRLTNPAAAEIKQELRSQATTVNPSLAAEMVVGVYAQDGFDDPSLVFDGYSLSAGSAIAAQVRGMDPAGVVELALRGSGVSTSQNFPTGRFGGSLKCGVVEFAAVATPVCAWADARSTAEVVLRDAVSPAQAAMTTLTLRNAAEH